MEMNKWLLLMTAAVLSGCAAQVPTIPYKRPMQAPYQPAVKDLQVYTYVEEKGVGVGYFAKDYSGVMAWLIGGPLLYGVVMATKDSPEDKVADSPARRQSSEQSAELANELAKEFDHAGTERQWEA